MTTAIAQPFGEWGFQKNAAKPARRYEPDELDILEQELRDAWEMRHHESQVQELFENRHAAYQYSAALRWAALSTETLTEDYAASAGLQLRLFEPGDARLHVQTFLDPANLQLIDATWNRYVGVHRFRAGSYANRIFVNHAAEASFDMPLTGSVDMAYDYLQEGMAHYRSAASRRPVDFPGRRPVDSPTDASVLRIGGLAGFAVLFLSIPLLLLDVAAGLAGMFLGTGLFALANYAAYRVGEDAWILSPAVASKASLACLALAITSAVAGLAG